MILILLYIGCFIMNVIAYRVGYKYDKAFKRDISHVGYCFIPIFTMSALYFALIICVIDDYIEKNQIDFTQYKQLVIDFVLGKENK